MSNNDYSDTFSLLLAVSVPSYPKDTVNKQSERNEYRMVVEQPSNCPFTMTRKELDSYPCLDDFTVMNDRDAQHTMMEFMESNDIAHALLQKKDANGVFRTIAECEFGLVWNWL